MVLELTKKTRDLNTHLINFDNVLYVSPMAEGAIVVFSEDEYMHVTETLKEIKAQITVASKQTVNLGDNTQ